MHKIIIQLVILLVYGTSGSLLPDLQWLEYPEPGTEQGAKLLNVYLNSSSDSSPFAPALIFPPSLRNILAASPGFWTEEQRLFDAGLRQVILDGHDADFIHRLIQGSLYNGDSQPGMSLYNHVRQLIATLQQKPKKDYWRAVRGLICVAEMEISIATRAMAVTKGGSMAVMKAMEESSNTIKKLCQPFISEEHVNMVETQLVEFRKAI